MQPFKVTLRNVCNTLGGVKKISSDFTHRLNAICATNLIRNSDDKKTSDNYKSKTF